MSNHIGRSPRRPVFPYMERFYFTVRSTLPAVNTAFSMSRMPIWAAQREALSWNYECSWTRAEKRCTPFKQSTKWALEGDAGTEVVQRNMVLFLKVYFLIDPWARGRSQNHVFPGECRGCPRALHWAGEWNDLLSTHINLLNISVVS